MEEGYYYAYGSGTPWWRNRLLSAFWSLFPPNQLHCFNGPALFFSNESFSVVYVHPLPSGVEILKLCYKLDLSFRCNLIVFQLNLHSRIIKSPNTIDLRIDLSKVKRSVRKTLIKNNWFYVAVNNKPILWPISWKGFYVWGTVCSVPRNTSSMPFLVATNQW